jgi:3-dehydroquinate dehydratase
MIEGPTRNPSDTRSFEERVFARFDTMEARFEARFDAVEARLDALDSRVQALEARALDTKPIWERALAAIIEVKEGEDIKRKFEIVSQGATQSASRPTVC